MLPYPNGPYAPNREIENKSYQINCNNKSRNSNIYLILTIKRIWN